MDELLGLIMILIIISAILLPAIASAKIKNTFNTYSNKETVSGITGAQAAQQILSMNGLDVEIQSVKGTLTDYYNPVDKSLALSEGVHNVNSIAAIAIATHECGHAIQDAYMDSFFVRLRQSICPITNIANHLYMPLIILGLFLPPLAGLGVILFAITTIFSIVTLPVEFDASKRALVILEDSGMLTEEELYGAQKVLSAAALTYVAAAVSSILVLLRLLIIFLGLLARRN